MEAMAAGFCAAFVFVAASDRILVASALQVGVKAFVRQNSFFLRCGFLGFCHFGSLG